MKYSIWFLVLLINGITSFAQTNVQIGFGSTDIRYAKASSATITQPVVAWQAIAWKGEKVHAQLLICTKTAINSLRVTGSALIDGKGHRIPASAITIGFIRYVLTDSLNKEGHGCGIPPASQSDSLLVADGIDFIQQKEVPAFTTQPVWVSIAVPVNTIPGKYNGLLYVQCNGFTRTLSYCIQVKAHTLPPPAQWSFHLDLWQNPYAVARIYGVKEWSKEHFDHLRPYMQWLAAAGQKTITVSMIHDPWRGQTYDIYKSMIKWIKKKNGTWSYDYSVFDQWVSFMQSLGINKLINCYTMVPWNNKFYYYDEALQRDTVLIAKTGTPEYEAHWRPMLTGFVQHLKQKGWYNKTAIAMDERPLEDMLKVIRLIREVDSGIKISLAGSYHPELAGELYDYCIASAEIFESTVLRKRVDAGLPTTYYTYCWEGHPNTFTFSPPAEAAWLGWYAANKQFNGYLRWAYNCWPRNPLQDSRYSTWSAGDTYLVYPGGSSIRFERLIEGIQDYEKIRILKATYKNDT
ncbi:MAG TPA: glycoside hydrolase domain-containing protein, partial [Niastella sp.]|nr:glycoside hydrolase domain-containing protein [Niastella sp.]